MNSRARIGIIIVLAAVGLLAFGVIVLNGIIRTSMAPPPAPTAMPIITEKIVAASHDVALGTLLKATDIKMIDLPVGYVPRNAIKDVQSVVGQITKVELVSGEFILTHNLANPTNINHDLAYVLGDQLVLMAFPADDLMSQLNLIERGDVIDILTTITEEVEPSASSLEAAAAAGEEPKKESRAFTFAALQRVGVTAIVVDILTTKANPEASVSLNVTADSTPVPTPTPLPDDMRTQSYLLALNPQDALVLKNLIDSGGKFDIVLRDPTSTELFQLSPVMKEYLLERYQLELAK